MENWKLIKGFEDYKISDLGRVYSIKSEKMLSLETMNIGYIRVQLSRKGKAKKILVHRLVGAHFLKTKAQSKEINHKDEDKSNNAFENLEWCTHKENMNKGTVQKRKNGSTNYQKHSKIVYQFNLNGVLVNKWNTVNDPKYFGYSPGNISNCCNNKFGVKKNIYRNYIWSF